MQMTRNQFQSLKPANEYVALGIVLLEESRSVSLGSRWAAWGLEAPGGGSGVIKKMIEVQSI